MIINNRAKISIIKSGNILLEVNPVIKQVSPRTIKLCIIIILTMMMFTIIAIHLVYNNYIVTFMSAAVVIGFGAFSSILVFYLANRGASLVFTEKGLYMGQHIAELWSDISAYNYVVYDKLDKWTLASLSGGTSLVIYNHGAIQRSINWKGHSLIAVNGVFLSNEQISIVDEIFASNKIPKH